MHAGLRHLEGKKKQGLVPSGSESGAGAGASPFHTCRTVKDRKMAFLNMSIIKGTFTAAHSRQLDFGAILPRMAPSADQHENDNGWKLSEDDRNVTIWSSWWWS
jgi:hypothetical protein